MVVHTIDVKDINSDTNVTYSAEKTYRTSIKIIVPQLGRNVTELIPFRCEISNTLHCNHPTAHDCQIFVL